MDDKFVGVIEVKMTDEQIGKWQKLIENTNKTFTLGNIGIIKNTENINQIADLQNRIKLALCESVGVLYFNDASDYETALWKIIEYLGGKDAVELLERDEQQAFQKYCRSELNGE